MPQLDRPRQREEFEIAILCALQAEHDAIEAVLDEDYEDGHPYGKAPGDQNSYTTGRIGVHHVVIAYMPGMGKAHAATVASGIRGSFTGIRLEVLAGVCGGAPKSNHGVDILLGDVIVSSAIVQVDFGRQYSDKRVMKDTSEGNLGPPNPEIRSFIKKASGLLALSRLREKTALYCEQFFNNVWLSGWEIPDTNEDKLFHTRRLLLVLSVMSDKHLKTKSVGQHWLLLAGNWAAAIITWSFDRAHRRLESL